MNGLIIFSLGYMCDGLCECYVDLESPRYLVNSGWGQVIECKLVWVSRIMQLLVSGPGVSPSVVIG